MRIFNATLMRNIQQDGACLAIITITLDDKIENQFMNPWINVEAGKHWIKEQFKLISSSDKEIELVSQEFEDNNGIPILYSVSESY